MPLNLLKLHFS